MTNTENTPSLTERLAQARIDFYAYCDEGFPENESVSERIATAASMYDAIRALHAAIDGSDPRGPILSSPDMTPAQIRARSLARADAFDRLADEHDGTGFSDSAQLRAVAASIREAAAL